MTQVRLGGTLVTENGQSKLVISTRAVTGEIIMMNPMGLIDGPVTVLLEQAGDQLKDPPEQSS